MKQLIWNSILFKSDKDFSRLLLGREIDEKIEEWRVIPFAPSYEASNLGRIRRNKVLASGKIKVEILIGGMDENGYRIFALRNDRKNIYKSCHRLVAETWLGPCPEGMQVCHNNGIKLDNRLSNLRYDTPLNNTLDKVKHGTQTHGENHVSAHLKAAQVKEIFVSDLSLKQLSEKYGVTESNIRAIKTRKNWIKETEGLIVGGMANKKGPLSKYVGVTKNGKFWIARLTHDRERIIIGRFMHEIEAAKAYNNKVVELGLNKPLNEFDE